MSECELIANVLLKVALGSLPASGLALFLGNVADRDWTAAGMSPCDVVDESAKFTDVARVFTRDEVV
jgi:hypothetical protein